MISGDLQSVSGWSFWEMCCIGDLSKLHTNTSKTKTFSLSIIYMMYMCNTDPAWLICFCIFGIMIIGDLQSVSCWPLWEMCCIGNLSRLHTKTRTLSIFYMMYMCNTDPAWLTFCIPLGLNKITAPFPDRAFEKTRLGSHAWQLTCQRERQRPATNC